MPKYTVQDEKTGKKVTFEWNGKGDPTDADIEQVFASLPDTQKPGSNKDSGDFVGSLMGELDGSRLLDPKARSDIYRPLLEGGGALLGGAGGLLAGAPTGPGAAVTSAVGTGLMYGVGKGAADSLDMLSGVKKPYSGAKEAFLESAKDVAMGTAFAAGGEAAPVAIKSGARLLGKVARPTLGRLSGVGTGAINESIKTSVMYRKALRGKITATEIVDNAKNALQKLVARRSANYRASLAKISEHSDDIDMAPIRKKLKGLMEEYNVSVRAGKEGLKIDTSRVAMGKKGRKDIKELIEGVSGWGSKKGDATPIGLDTLKRQLDDFYSDSSQARAFVKSLTESVKKTASDAVPEYKRMLKDYSEATTLIKDIESGLMLRKKGMSGRIIADQTLRRLLSSMRDNFALRKELVEVLGNSTATDLSGQIAGYTMRSPVPVGLAGTGTMLAGQVGYAMINPKFWPVLAASSPRVQGEFLSQFGKAMKMYQSTSKLMKSESLKQYLIANKKKENKK